MKIYTSLQKQNLPLCVALGYFDGVHKGHRKVISKTLKYKSLGLVPSVFTFSGNPRTTLLGIPENRITDNTTKQNILENIGIKILYMIDFKTVCNLSAEEFVRDVLKDTLNAKYVVCGFNYHFGKNGTADANILKKLCSNYGIKTKIIRPVLYKRRPISSTRIREAIINNDENNANKMLNK